jgi:hypothetical protein
LKSLDDEIAAVYAHWMSTEPKLGDVKRVRALVYALLHRNIRWTEGFHHWMFALERLPLTQTQKAQAARWCAQQPFTGPGQTVPSYRIPVLWEHYLLGLRQAVAPPQVAAPTPVPAQPKKPMSKKHATSTHS